VKKGATSVRFSDELSAILKKISCLYEVTDVAVVRWAVKALGVYHDANGQLPPLTTLDPRQADNQSRSNQIRVNSHGGGNAAKARTKQKA
jgi:hypothetical protein